MHGVVLRFAFVSVVQQLVCRFALRIFAPENTTPQEWYSHLRCNFIFGVKIYVIDRSKKSDICL